MAAQILLATLAVPVEHPDLDLLKVQVHMTTYAAMENVKARLENARKMCMYAGINAIPTRCVSRPCCHPTPSRWLHPAARSAPLRVG